MYKDRNIENLTQLSRLYRILFNLPYMYTKVVAPGDDLSRVKAVPLTTE
mgnify:CR=1 FL=1